MDQGKEYWIRIFIKKCISLKDSQNKLDFYLTWCKNTYNVSEENLKELKETFTIDDYINRLIPVIDKYFSVEELKEVIKFYSTETGRKLLNYNFSQDMGKIGSKMEIQIEQEFAIKNKK